MTDKTYVVDQRVRDQILTLFGSTANAARRLETGLSYQLLNQALRGHPVTERDGRRVEAAWDAWATHYLRGHGLGLLPPDEKFTRPGADETADLEREETREWRRRLIETKSKVNLRS